MQTKSVGYHPRKIRVTKMSWLLQGEHRKSIKMTKMQNIRGISESVK